MKFRLLFFGICVFSLSRLFGQITMPGYEAVESRDGIVRGGQVTRLMSINKETEDLIYTATRKEVDKLVALLTIEFGEPIIRRWIGDEAVYRGATKCEVLWTNKLYEKDTFLVVITRSFINGKDLIKVAKIENSVIKKNYAVSLDKVFKGFRFCDLVNGILILQNNFIVKCIDLSDFTEYDIPTGDKFDPIVQSNVSGELDFNVGMNVESIVYERLGELVESNFPLIEQSSHMTLNSFFRYQEHNWNVSISNIGNPFGVKKQIRLSDTVNNAFLTFEEVNSEWVVFLEVNNIDIDYDGVELKLKIRNNGAWRDLGAAVATKYSQSTLRTVYRLTPLNSRPLSFLKSIGYSEDLAIGDASNSIVFMTRSITCLTPLFYGALTLRDLSGSCHYVNCKVPNEDHQENLSLKPTSGGASYSQGSPYVGGSAVIQGSAVSDYQLGSRPALERPMPRYDCDGEGIVIVKVYVDRNGIVKRADGQGQKGSTTNNECLISRAEEAALRTRWQSDYSALELQIGTIRYNFLTQ